MKIAYYSKTTSNFSYESAHIYEHIFVASFRQRMTDKGFCLGLFGWVSGKVYSNTILIEGAFYDAKTEKLFCEFMRQPIDITDERIRSAVDTVSSEYGLSVEIVKKEEFVRELEEIARLPFRDIEEFGVLERIAENNCETEQGAVMVGGDKCNFKEVGIGFSYAGEELSDIAIIFRLWPVLLITLLSRLIYVEGIARATFPGV